MVDLTKINPYSMVDITEKKAVPRTAEAIGRITLMKKTIKAIKKGKVKKGDPLAVAEIACIQAVKRTPDLIPMCHNIPIDAVDANFEVGDDYVEARCRVSATYKTGVEMEALTGVSAALLTIWDMVKYLEKDECGQYPSTTISDIKVIEKRKGQS
ncbi:molybdenum cofactor biosynthesis protein C [Candidatus Bathyarchaeota archaeon RBG_13_52_12]|nr:MAG: molybdenum cofactor biosynthesis protein C [Candidatus Bathyarchaeota archaeon RBG_13_52_12]